MFLNCVLKPVCSDLTPREGFKNECARQRCDGLKDAMCATRVVFKGTGTIWLRCHRSRRQDRENRTPRMLPLTVSGQPLEISLERLGQSMSLYVSSFEQRNPTFDGTRIMSRQGYAVTNPGQAGSVVAEKFYAMALCRTRSGSQGTALASGIFRRAPR